MTPRAHILCMGTDPLLLSTRQAILEGEFVVTPLAGPTALEELDSSTPVDVLLLCHTLTEAERRFSATLFLQRWPGAAVILLDRLSTPAPSSAIGRHLSCLEGPLALLRGIRQALPAEASLASQPF